MQHLESTDQVLSALGQSSAAIARRFQVKRTAVVNWRARGRIPARLYERMRKELAKEGLSANPLVWGIIAADTPKRAPRKAEKSDTR